MKTQVSKMMFGSMALLLALSLIGAQCEQQPATTPTSLPTSTQSGLSVMPSPTKPAMPTQPAEPTYINLNLGGEPPTIDPGLAVEGRAVQCVELLFLGLTDYDQSLEVIPELAERWSVSSDGLKWTFTMRQDVQWVRYDPASGKAEVKRPVTARDVEYAVKRTLDPATASNYAYVLYVIKGGEAFNTAPVTNPVSADTVGVKALDDYTVEFELERPAGYFPGIAGMWVCRPVPREVVEEHGEAWTEPGTVWTNGPYMMTSWEHENTIDMVKNPAYYDAAAVQIDQINWFMIAQQSTALSMYENGELDVTALPGEALARFRQHPVLSQELYAAPALCTGYYGFNTTKSPVDNVHVRRALSYAVDRQTLVDAVLGGGQKPATTFASPGIFGSPAEDPNFRGIEFDPAQARRELAAAGYPGGQGLPQITFFLTTSENAQRIAEFCQANWKEHLGVEVKVVSQEWGTYLQTLRQDAPQVFALAWCADYPDENNWVMECFHSTKGANRIRWSNAEFDQLVEQAARESDPAKRKDLYFKAEHILCVDEAGIIPIAYTTIVVVTKSYVTRTYGPSAEHIDRWRVDRP